MAKDTKTSQQGVTKIDKGFARVPRPRDVAVVVPPNAPKETPPPPPPSK
jgi:hypothetical protein